jgi:nucleotide-binding universal stress UspA family protein
MAGEPLAVDDSRVTATLDTIRDSCHPGCEWGGDVGAAPTIVCAVDGSVASRGAAAVAAGLTRRLDWPLVLVPQSVAQPTASRRDWLVAAAAEEGAEVLITPYGTADSLALAASVPCPVVVAPRSRVSRPYGDGPVVCGVAESGSSAAAVRAAARLAAALGVRLKLVHVASPAGSREARRANARSAFSPILWDALRSLDPVPPPVDLMLEIGAPGERLRAVAADEAAALLVIGAPRISRRNDDPQGSTAVLRDSTVPVMLVRSGMVEPALQSSRNDA